jgi:endonuclease/exonuclease/phosphatase family metal-dependent hydrolase
MNTLRIGCWNVKTGEPTADIRNRLADLDLDVVLLQEVDLWTPRVSGRNVPRELFQSWPSDGDTWAWAFGPSLQSEPVCADDAPALFGNLVAVRGRIDECLPVDLGPLGSDPSFHDRAPNHERRSAVLARIRARGRSLVVASAHLRYGEGQSNVRKAQTLRLLALLDRFARPGDAVVLAADFNASAEEIDTWALPSIWQRGTPSTSESESVTMRIGVDHVLVRGACLSGVCSLSAEGLSDHHPFVLALD